MFVHVDEPTNGGEKRPDRSWTSLPIGVSLYNAVRVKNGALFVGSGNSPEIPHVLCLAYCPAARVDIRCAWWQC